MRLRSSTIPEFELLAFEYNQVIKGKLLKNAEKLILSKESNFFFTKPLFDVECVPIYNETEMSQSQPSETPFLIPDNSTEGSQFINPPRNILIFETLINHCIIYSVGESLNDLSYKSNYQYKSIVSEVIWGLFVIDFISNFFINKRTTDRILNKKYSITINYLKTWALFDFVSLIPFRFTGNPNTESFCKLTRVFKLSRLFQMIQIKSFARFCIKKIKSTDKRYPFIEIVIELVWEWIKIVLGMVFLAFALSCIWFYFSELYERYNFTAENFLSTYNFKELRNYEKVIKTMYFITTTLLTVGYGDMRATNIYEMGFCCALVTIGASIFAYTMSLAGNYIKTLSKLVKKSKKEAEIKKMIGVIKSFKGTMTLSLECSLINFLQYFCEKDRLGSLAKTNKITNNWKKFNQRNDKIFKKLPPFLKKTILDTLFNDVFRHFRFLFSERNEFRYHICTFFLPRIFQYGMFLAKENEKCDEIILVRSGSVQLCYEDLGDFLIECKTFSGWFVVGDYSVVLEKKSFASFLAVSQVEGFGIPEKAFMMIILRYFPKYLDELKRVVKRRTSKLLEIMRDRGYDSYEQVIKNLYKHTSDIVHNTVIPIKELTLKEIYLNIKQKDLKNYQLGKSN